MINKTKHPKFESINALCEYLKENIQNTFSIVSIEYEALCLNFLSGRIVLAIELDLGMKIYLMWEDLDEVTWAFQKFAAKEDTWALDSKSMHSKIDALEKQLKEIEEIKQGIKQSNGLSP